MTSFYQDIRPRFKALDIPPNAQGVAYTVPVIGYTDPGSKEAKYIMDSDAIADFLDRTFPERQLFRGPPELQSAQREFLRVVHDNVYKDCRPFVLGNMVAWLHPVSSAYFRSTYEPLVGPMAKMLMPSSKYDAALAKLTEGLEFIGAWLDREGRVLGKEVLFTADEESERAPTYALLAFAGVLEWLHRTGGPKVWNEVLGVDGGRWAVVWEAAVPYIHD